MAEPSTRRISDVDEAATPKAGDIIAGKYRVEGVVGSGGMGIVVSAQHLQLGQRVAIKLLSVASLESERRDEARARFLREGQAAARLTSDHVVRIYDVGTTDSGEPFMVMELLRGDDLGAILDRSGPAPVDVAVEYIVQACDAVGEAHSHGIVHRDLKPSNLFVSRRNDGRVSVKVLDFGISKAVVPGSEHFEGSLTATRTVVGSPYYMSPEQVRDAKRVDTRTDLWSMGMILYELLTGEPAFNADTLPGICAAIAADAPPSIRGRRSEVPVEMEQIVLRCLEKDPARRFQTIAELVQALTPFLPRPGSTESVDYVSRGSQLLAGDAPRRNSPDQATVAQPAENGPPVMNTGTLMSPRHQPSGSRPASSKGPVVVLPAGRETPVSGKQLADFERSATLVSGQSRRAGRPKGNSALFLATGAGLALGIAAIAYFALRPQERAASDAPAVAAAPTRFSLSIESVPGGADVLEGDRILGKTPLSITVDSASVATSPRQFTVRLDGYEPYAVSQGPSESSVRVLATLAARPRTEAPATQASVAAAAPVAPVPRAPQKKGSPHAPTRTPPGSNSDIRLER